MDLGQKHTTPQTVRRRFAHSTMAGLQSMISFYAIVSRGPAIIGSCRESGAILPYCFMYAVSL